MQSVNISEIGPGMRGLQVTGKITEIGEVREVMTRFGPAKVAGAMLTDQTGSIRLNLWRDQIGRVRVGDTVDLVNAFVRVFNGRTELNIGKDGKILALDKL